MRRIMSGDSASPLMTMTSRMLCCLACAMTCSKCAWVRWAISEGATRSRALVNVSVAGRSSNHSTDSTSGFQAFHDFLRVTEETGCDQKGIHLDIQVGPMALGLALALGSGLGAVRRPDGFFSFL